MVRSLIVKFSAAFCLAMLAMPMCAQAQAQGQALAEPRGFQGAVQGDASSCQDWFMVQALPWTMSVDESKSMAELSGSDSGIAEARSEMGVVEAVRQVELVREYKSDDGCSMLELKVAFVRSKMSIAKELSLDKLSCPYKEILGHEIKHVGVFERRLAQAPVEIAKRLSERWPDRQWTGSPAQRQEAVEIARSWLAGADALQADVDEPSEYARLDAACSGELRAIS